MRLNIQDEHVWVFDQLYCILANFADKPENVIRRIGAGRISIPDDQGEELYQFRRTILSNYPDAASLEIMRVTAQIEAILDRHTPSASAPDWFWTNNGFIQHDDWQDIRDIAREFLIR